MIEHFSSIRGGLVTTGVVVAGSLATILAQTVIGDSTGLQIGLVGGLLIGVFWAGRQMQRITDGQKQTHRRLLRIERKLHIDDGTTDDYNEDQG
jgi:FtsH-binding integral membrane protein